LEEQDHLAVFLIKIKTLTERYELNDLPSDVKYGLNSLAARGDMMDG